jgi:mRNA-degrading endonuclease RelE of RelBE toxin-antitoxin system
LASKRAEHDWARLPRSEVPRYHKVLEMIARGDPRVTHAKKLVQRRVVERFGTEVMSLRASRELRLLFTREHDTVTVVGFAHRNDKSIYSNEGW